MKKTVRSIILLTVAVALVLSLGTSAYAVKNKDYEYTLNENNEATIIAYNGDAMLLTVPDTIDDYPVVGIGDLAFAGNENLYRVNIPLSVREIGINPFAGCTDLRRIYVSPRNELFSTDRGVLFSKVDKKLICVSPQMWIGYNIPSGIEIIGEKAFSGASELERISIPASVKTIEAGAFEGCAGFTEIIVPNSVMVIGDSAFENCTSLQTIQLSENLISIGNSAFENCTSLKTLQFSENLLSIGNSAFKNCVKLEGLELPEKLTSIGSSAFAGCASLTDLVLPASVERVGYEAFKNCAKLSNVNMLAGNLAELGESALEGCTSLEVYAVPGSLGEVPANLCAGCTALEFVHIMEGIESVGAGAFSGCENLITVMLHDGLKTIGSQAFKDCSSLYELELPDSITGIRPDAFADCYDLRLVVNRDTYNEQFAAENGVYYIFPDSFDWMKPPIEVGDTVTFGRYEQDNDASNGAEDIEWTVLDIDEETGCALVISNYALDCRKYNTENKSVTWETCSLRKWLNEEFYNSSFNPDEQAMIETTKVTADKNPQYNTVPGNDTNDRVFLLSIDEVNRYFNSDEERMCLPTAYAEANGAYVNDSMKNCLWWLRSPGYNRYCAADVTRSGSTYYYGHGASSGEYGVRPALWINPDSSIF